MVAKKRTTKKPLEEEIDDLAADLARELRTKSTEEKWQGLKILTSYLLAKDKMAPPPEPNKGFAANEFANALKDGVRGGNASLPDGEGDDGSGPGQF